MNGTRADFDYERAYLRNLRRHREIAGANESSDAPEQSSKKTDAATRTARIALLLGGALTAAGAYRWFTKDSRKRQRRRR